MPPHNIDLVFEKINREHPQDKGKIVAIESESGDFFIGTSGMNAYQKAKQKYPHQQFVFKRIGFKSAFFVGAVE